MDILPSPVRPLLFLDEHRCRQNIDFMIRRASDAGVVLRPHMKTHQSITIGSWFRERGITGATVSSTGMALYFAEGGWSDLTIAFPFFRQMSSDLKKLESTVNLRLFLNNTDDLQYLESFLQKPFGYYIEIDPGYGRSGISETEDEQIDKLVSYGFNSDSAVFHGFYIHEGRTYSCRGKKEIEERITPALSILKRLKSKYPQAAISLGDTPACSVSDQLGLLDEMTPGNFVFYDYMQYKIGSCSLNQIALFAVHPLAQAHNSAGRSVLHGGAAHLSKDFIYEDEKPTYGRVIHYSPDSISLRENAHLRSLSQEHSIVEGLDHLSKNEQFIWICPIHSCLTSNLHSEYQASSGRIIKKRILS